MLHRRFTAVKLCMYDTSHDIAQNFGWECGKTARVTVGAMPNDRKSEVTFCNGLRLITVSKIC
jgi:hypothetical protein